MLYPFNYENKTLLLRGELYANFKVLSRTYDVGCGAKFVNEKAERLVWFCEQAHRLAIPSLRSLRFPVGTPPTVFFITKKAVLFYKVD